MEMKNRPALLAGIVGILVGLIAGYAAWSIRPAAPTEYETRTIVGLMPLTGALGTYGENGKVTASLAARDVNAWLEQEGKPWRLELKIEDTATHGPTALEKMKAWFGRGVRFFVGPYSSGECKESLTFADANKILFVSPSSTAPALAIAGDYLFRFPPDDAIQGPAIARTVWEAGVRHAIFTWRGDTWGDGLQKATAAAFGELGGQVYEQVIRYDPGLEDFPKEASLLNDYVADLVGRGVPQAQIGIIAIAFEEVAPYLAAVDAYPQVRDVLWFGSDGSALSEALVKHPVGSQVAIATKFMNTKAAPGVATYSRFDYVRGHAFEVLGREVEVYAYNAYDIVWSLALAIDEAGYDPEKAKAIFPRVAGDWTKLHGASGHVELNEFGDRAYADYYLWHIGADGAWTKAGAWRGATDAIEWDRPVY
jgi:branched-chain amino acid transport system substrate-binding protein